MLSSKNCNWGGLINISSIVSFRPPRHFFLHFFFWHFFVIIVILWQMNKCKYKKIQMLTESIFLSTVVPGDGGSRLEAQIHKPSVPHYWCEKTSSSWFDLWLSVESLLPEAIDCWADNIRCNFVIVIVIFLNFVSHKEKLNKKYCENLWGYCKSLHLTSTMK